MKLIILILSLLSFQSWSQDQGDAEVSDMCMNQIIAGLVDDGILGGNSGLCIKMSNDISGNISAIDFNMESTAFDLGKDTITDPKTLERLSKIKSFILDYQKTVTKNNNLTIDDIDLEIHSYADGVGGPKRYDIDIKRRASDGTLGKFIADDSDSISYLNNVKTSKPFNFDSISEADKSLIRNIYLSKKRSQTICSKLGGSKCNESKNLGFASPKLEVQKKECAERRVSLIRVNLDSVAVKDNIASGEFHPQFSVPKDEGEDNLKGDMQLAASFDMIRHHKGIQIKYADPITRNNFIQNEANKFIKTTLQNFDPSSSKITILDLPDSARNDSDLSSYKTILDSFNDRYSQLFTNLKGKHDDLLLMAEKGDFIAFKKRVASIQDPLQKRNLKKQIRLFLASRNGDVSTDYYNYFSAGQAIQFQLINKSHSPYLKNAATLMNGSNTDLTIKMNAENVMVPHISSKKPSLPWQCHGGCDSGIKEGSGGDFITDFRDSKLSNKNSEQMNASFQNPTSFGALKTLNVYTIRDCANCECLKDPTKPIESVLSDKSGRVTKTSIDRFSIGTDGKKSFSKKVGAIEDPMSTCLFTPPVAHTCKVKPTGSNKSEVANLKSINYSCPFWDTSGKEHGLKYTANFINDVLGVVSTNGITDECRHKIMPLRSKAASATCNQTEPAKDACL